MMRRLLWGIRRELWENRWLYLAPMGLGLVVLLGFSWYAITLPKRMASQPATSLSDPYDVVAGLMMIAGLLAALFYCVDALYGERRDRSVLLWKSLPVSDTETVLTKLCIPVLVLPAIIWAVTMVVQGGMLLGSVAVFAAQGVSTAPLWAQVRIVPEALPLLYHLVALHGISAAPIYAWLLLVSAWAPRAPLAWGIFPPVAIAFLERVSSGTWHFAELLVSPVSAGMDGGQSPTGRGMGDMLAMRPPASFLAEPRLWVGLAIAALFVAATVRFRRRAVPA